MKFYWNWFFTLIILGFFSISFGQKNYFIHNIDQLSQNEKRVHSPINFKEATVTSNYDVNYYRLELFAKPDSHYISGSVTCKFTPTMSDSLIYFELNSQLMVDSITYQTSTIPHTHSDNIISISLPLLIHEVDSVTIHYHGSPPDGASFRTEMHNETPILWTLSEPYGAIDWWPCKQSLTDKADSIDVFVTVPKENKVAGNGILKSINNHGNNVTFHWECRYPIVPYLVAIAITPYSETSFYSKLTNGSLLVQNYIYKEDSARFHSQLFTADTLLRYYDSLIGEYPFMNEKYGHAQFGRGGGMEHQTMSFMTHFDFGLNAHELAHQWFGNKITCGSWADIWLNEGFATYFAGLPLETMYNGMYWNDWKNTFLERATRNNEQSIYVEDTTSVSRIFNPDLSYAKAGYVLHMLRKQVGDSVFLSGIRSYLLDTNLAYKSALTDDFFHHIELAADSSLSNFKNQWIYGIGYPSFNMEWDQVNQQFEAKFLQTTSSNTTPLFNITVPVLIIGEHDSLWLYLDQYTNENLVTRLVPFPIIEVLIDPNLDIISKSNFVIKKSKFNNLVMYPNPTSETLFIVPSGDFGTINEYVIIDSKGCALMRESDLRLSNTFHIDVSTFSQGNYQIQLTSGNSVRTESFVVTK
ncbi:MAG: M1 family aminopeptidase [Salibacteraceae bacterium]